MLDVRGYCCSASCMTQRVLRRFLAGTRGSIVCVARVHPTDHQRRRATRVSRGSHAGPMRVPRGSILHCAGPTHRLGF